ncbi:MAG: MarC family protein [Hyphomicrobiales bacterium]
MKEYFTLGLLWFTSFFTLINPLGIMPVFLSMTAGLNKEARRKVIVKALLVAFAILMAFAFGGQVLFKFFGISVDSFRVVGGIVFFIVGYDLLNARLTKIKIADKAQLEQYVEDVSITPLAIPIIAGPGAITNAIVLMEDATSIGLQTTLVVTLVLLFILIFFVLYGASRISKVLGDTGNKILMKIMGLIVMVIAVEFFFSGLKPILRDIFMITS